MKSNLGFFIGLLIVVELIYFVPRIIAGLLLEEDVPVPSIIILSIIIIIIGWVLYMVIQMGLIKIAIRFCDNEKPKIVELFSQYRLFFKYLFGLILYALIVFGGLILLIIPGIIWGIKFWFFDYFIIDKKLGPIEAFKRSSAITKGAKWNLFLFGLLLGLINLLGAIFLLIGLFITIPITMVATAFVYRKLLSQTEIVQAPEILAGEINK